MNEREWVSLTAIGDSYEVEMDVRSDPTVYRHRPIRLSGHHSGEDWKPGPPPGYKGHAAPVSEQAMEQMLTAVEADRTPTAFVFSPGGLRKAKMERDAVQHFTLATDQESYRYFDLPYRIVNDQDADVLLEAKDAPETTGFAQLVDDKRPARATGEWPDVWSKHEGHVRTAGMSPVEMLAEFQKGCSNAGPMYERMMGKPAGSTKPEDCPECVEGLLRVLGERLSDAEPRLRALRLWHWNKVLTCSEQMKLRARDLYQHELETDGPLRHWHEQHKLHIKFVQILNDFFPVGDTAEADASKETTDGN